MINVQQINQIVSVITCNVIHIYSTKTHFLYLLVHR